MTDPRRIRVAFDATSLIGERTGVGVLTAGMLQALVAGTGLDLRAFALTWRGRRALATEVPDGVRTVRWPLPASALQEIWTQVDAPVIEWFTGPIEVVHGTNFVVPPAARAARIVTVHDLTAIRFPELCQPATLRYPGLIRRALQRGAWVHTFSQAMANEVMESLGAAPERVRVVAPGAPQVGGVGEAGAAGPVVGGGRPYILSLGRSEPRKDLPLLVRAFDQMAANHPDVELVIAGPPGWAEAQVADALAGARHRDRIRRRGWVTDGQKAALLAGATVFAYPSVYEGFGIPPLEAMAAGVPVVATAAGGVPEAVGSAARLVPVGDGDALAAAMAELIDDPGERATLVAAGHRQVARFSWATCGAGLDALYRDAAATRDR